MGNVLIGFPNEHEDKIYNYISGLRNFIRFDGVKSKEGVSVSHIEKAVNARRELFENFSDYFHFLDKCSKGFSKLDIYKKINIRDFNVGKVERSNGIIIDDDFLISESIKGIEELAQDKGIVVSLVNNNMAYNTF